ncbi:RNHCP domain-containing protein [Candidatus Gracilibacteria bacterium]|nr:RNHCP domain-containing protein [Candidatus Gracilibacteria bacterium]NUJ99228.1 RNHCP domain-containing protein [Candidatus Gracilibacteria bacterium]
MRNEEFICENCGKKVNKHPLGSARNHCPFCLFSKHLDDSFPGDRASLCKGIMLPSGIDYKKNKGYMIEHTCKKCGKKIINKLAPDDDFLSWVRERNGKF